MHGCKEILNSTSFNEPDIMLQFNSHAKLLAYALNMFFNFYFSFLNRLQ